MQHLRRALALLCLVLPAAAQRLPQKQVAAPPADVEAGVVRLPERALERSRAAWLPLAWTPADGRWQAQVTLPVERAAARGRELALALFGPDAARWSARLSGAGFAGEALAALAASGRAHGASQAQDELAPGWDALSFTLSGALPGRLVVAVDAGLAPRAPAGGFLVVGDGEAPTLASAVEGRRWTIDRPLDFTARLEEAGALDDVRVLVASALGTQEESLRDDGLGADALAGDGVWSARVWPEALGSTQARVVALGHDADGAFVRTAQHALTVLAPRARLSGRVRASVLDAATLALSVEVETDGSAPVQLALEVWGERPGAGAVPIVWLSRMSAPEGAGARWIDLALDARWLNAAGSASGLELRRLRLQDPDTHVVLDALERAPLALAALPALVGGPAGAITPDMLSRPALGEERAAAGPPRSGQRLGLLAAAPAPLERPRERSLLLVHGYCAGGSPWPPAQFSQPRSAFADPDQNRSHDAFAQLLGAFAAQEGLDSFGVVAHSQGGAAALHLLTYYQSGLERSFGGRRIQSVGTPYQGTPLASLGSFACGVNDDMTPSGSAAWLAGIPSWARAEVHYWTTSNAGSACNFFTNLVLGSPNDGVIEMARGQLPGATNHGHKTGWCHSTGMSNPAHYTDAVRNAEMNAAAAR